MSASVSSPGTIAAPRRKPRLELADSVLTRAAQSIADGRPHTVVDVLHHRALKHYAEGLRQYLVLRLGATSAAVRAMRRLRAVVAAQESDELVKPPGIRARLYRLARDLSATPEGDGEDLPWRIPREPKRAARVQRLRDHLPREDAEILELRYARELRPAEVAFVIGAPIEGTLEALHDATRQAAKVARIQTGDPLRRLLREAYALEASIPTTRDADESLDGPSLPTGSVIGGRYRIQARVGTGAFGDVYRAQDADVPGHVVALKLLHQPAYSDRARQGALRELRHLASVFHPSVVHLKDHGWHDGRLWFVMPWYDGETLESRLQQGPLPRAEARRIFEQLARALAAVHAAGLRHQDVKPENIFLAEMPGEQDALPVLIDFGVAATEAEMVVAGTPTYFAPEVAAQFSSVEDKPRVTSRADVFSLALALRNCLDPETQDDIPAGAVEAFIEERATTRPPLPSPRSLRFLNESFRRWLHLDQWERPTAEEFAQELAVLTMPEERRRRRWRTIRWMVPLLVTIGAAFAGAFYHFQLREEATRAQAAAAVAEVREDLQQTDAERRRIAEDAARIQRSLEQSRLGRTVLESELANTQATLDAERVQATAVRGDLQVRTRELGETRTQLSESDAALDAERARTREQQQTLARTEDEVRSLRTSLAQSRRGVQELERTRDRLEERTRQQGAEISRARAAAAASDARAETLEAEVARAVDAQHEAERAQRDAERGQREAEQALQRASEAEPPPSEPPAVQDS
ncbi:MAG: protein kinase [Myxococcota bacterium]